MVVIPAGSYPVGAVKPDLLAESTRRSVEVAGFSIDEHEVTNAQYKAFADATGAAPPLAGWSQRGPSDELLDHPVRAITFDWASAYCTSLGKRLPTEIEWEVAAGGPDGSKYAWGDDVAAVTLPAKGTHAVMSIPASKSALGVFDLTGNVWEWVTDPYDANKVGANQRVLRGGQDGYVRNNWNRLPVDEGASTAVLGAGIRCVASQTSSDVEAGVFGVYKHPPAPKPPTVTVPPGYKFFDDFSGSKLEWIEVTQAKSRFGYHPNKFFHLETKAPDVTVIALCPCTTPPAPVNVSTMAEVEPNLTESAGAFEWGLVIRSGASGPPDYLPSEYTALVVNLRKQTWRAYAQRSDGSTTPLGSAQFNAEESDVISLELRDRGTKVEFYINGTYRGESPPGVTLPSGNNAGFIVSSDAASTKAHIHFGNFGIRSS
jgi:hypothetical protein